MYQQAFVTKKYENYLLKADRLLFHLYPLFPPIAKLVFDTLAGNLMIIGVN